MFNKSRACLGFLLMIVVGFSCFLRAGINQDQMELFKAILKDDADKIKLLVKAGVDIDQEINNVRPLVVAIKHEKLNAFNSLLACGAEFDFMHESKKLVHYALNLYSDSMLEYRIHAKMACVLIDKGADFSGKYSSSYGDGTSLINAVIRAQNSYLIEALINNGCDIKNIKTNAFWTSSNAKIINLLLENGLNPNHRNEKDGISLFQIMIFSESLESVRLLLKAGADPNLKTSNKSPFSYAMERGNIEIVELLESYGARL